MVRATFAGFTTALSALQANQKRLDITGQNLSNMNTIGYTRQRLDTSSLNYSGGISHNMNGANVVVGFGVAMDGVSQIRDPYLDVQYRIQMTKADYSNSIQTSLDSLSGILDESNISGIREALDNIKASLNNMQDPAKIKDPIYESELRSRMEAFAALLNKSSTQLTEAEKSEFDRITGAGTSEQGAVEKVNDILQQIGNLNVQIKALQVAGQPALELQDERNVLLDELSSYLPIEVTYYKDANHDGLDANGQPLTNNYEEYEFDAQGNIIGKKQWPDDLKVEMVYKDAQGNTQRLTLVNGSDRGPDNKTLNYAQLEAVKATDGTAADRNTPTDLAVKFNEAPSAANPGSVSISADSAEQLSGGSILAGLDMLDSHPGDAADVRGYEFYREKLDTLAKTFAKTMNDLNKAGGGGGNLISCNNASDIAISDGWKNGTVHIGTVDPNDPTDTSSSDTILKMYKAMDEALVEGKSFSDFMNHVSTQLATDSSTNTATLKTDVTVLNSIQNSRDSISGVSMDEEATNMMSYVSAYNAASRLMTALDEVLNTLINSTGLVGR